MKKQQSLLPIIKVVSSCNLACSYCSAEQYMDHNRSSVMSNGALKRVIEEIGRTQERPRFLWHGGEPLLAGKDFYRQVVKIQEDLGLTQRSKNTMQSNALLMTKEWADFFVNVDFSIGFSIDGPASIHDAVRVLSNQKGSHSRVARGIENAINAGLHPGVLVVVTKQSVSYPEEIFTFLVEQGYTIFDFKPCYGSSEYDVSLSDYAIFMNQVFDMWIGLDNPDIHIRTLEGFIQNMIGGKAHACSQSGNCSSLITIDHDGSVYPCDRFIEPQYLFGNICDSPLDELYNESEGAKRFHEMVDNLQASCEGCRYINACKSGCTQERMYWPDEYCASRASIIDRISGWLEAQGVVLTDCFSD